MVDEIDVVRDRIKSAFPLSMSAVVERAFQNISVIDWRFTNDDIGPISIGGEKIHIPYRIYANEPIKPFSIEPSKLEELIISALYTRHFDGKVRQANIKPLLDSNLEWIPPFVLQLASEYVVEINHVIAASVYELCQEVYTRFAEQNPEFLQVVRARIVSYWSCYYRNMDFRDYPGYKFLNALDMWDDREAKWLLRRNRGQ